jgi:ankyrin repeat protein
VASIEGHASTVTILLNEGADIHAKNRVSILDDHTEYIYRIHVISDLMTIIDMQVGGTALICASRGGHQSICQLLLTRGADIDTKDRVSILDDHTEYIYRIHHHYHRLFM